MFLWLCRERLSQIVKSEILMSKSETNSNLECSNDKNKPSKVESGKRVLDNAVSVIWISVIWYCFEIRISCFGFIRSMEKRDTHASVMLPQSPSFGRGFFTCGVKLYLCNLLVKIDRLLPKSLFAWSKMFFDPAKLDSSPAIQRDWQKTF